ncbi:hypothetical protein AHAS_Ahas10G0149700 [Arachis hypogaea]
MVRILWLWSTKFTKVGNLYFQPNLYFSGCECNWSIFEHIHSKKRIQLEHKKFNNLIYVHYNLGYNKSTFLIIEVKSIILKF